VLRSQHDFLLGMKWAKAAQDPKNPLNREKHCVPNSSQQSTDHLWLPNLE
jgi:hypothetical protein